jgi:hypothetical protein
MSTILELTYELARQEGKIVKQCPECNGYFISNDITINCLFNNEVCIYCLAGEKVQPLEKTCKCGCGKTITNGGYPIPRNHLYYSRSCSVRKYRNDRKINKSK